MKTASLLWAGVAAALTCSMAFQAMPAAAAPAPAYSIQLVDAECPHRTPQDLIEGQSVLCGRMRLPQDRAKPKGLQVEIPYALIKSSSPTPKADPLLYIVGGPGGSALTEFPLTFSWFRPFRAERDIVIYDQRGTRLATPKLDCSPFVSAVSAGDKRRADARIPAAFRPVDDETAALPRCVEQFKRQGIDLTKYDTTTHAQDAADLMKALGYTTYNVYGTSYGTRVALEMMRTGADGLRAAVLDSAYPPQVNAYETQKISAPFEIARITLRQCEADSDCNAAFPDLTERFDGLFAKLNQAPLKVPVNTSGQFTGDDLAMFVLTFNQPEQLPYFPLLIDELDRGLTTTLSGLLTGELPPVTPAPTDAPASTPDFSYEETARMAEAVQNAYFALIKQSGAKRRAAEAEYNLMINRNPDRARLVKFIQDYLPQATFAGLLPQLEALSDAGVASVFSNLAGPLGAPPLTAANLASECRDEIPFNRFDVAMRAYVPLGITQQSAQFRLDTVRLTFAQCALFPTGKADTVQTLAVTSNIPTLVYQGLFDAVTPPSWSASALPYLNNHYAFDFPAQLHVMLRQPKSLETGCAADIAIAFLDDPSQTPDADCIKDTYGFHFVTK